MQRLIGRTAERDTHTHTHTHRQCESWASCLWRHRALRHVRSLALSRRKAAMVAAASGKINIYLARAAVSCCDYVCLSLSRSPFLCVCEALSVPVSAMITESDGCRQPSSKVPPQNTQAIHMHWQGCRFSFGYGPILAGYLSPALPIFLSGDWKLRNSLSTPCVHRLLPSSPTQRGIVNRCRCRCRWRYRYRHTVWTVAVRRQLVFKRLLQFTSNASQQSELKKRSIRQHVNTQNWH